GTLTKGGREEIVTQIEVERQLEGEKYQNGAQSGVSRQAAARSTRYREAGHNSRTCKKYTVDTA
ncbi:hypothetical protein K432DRAFT_312342, partial [Lepidopterella palustris CBS 459.81]